MKKLTAGIFATILGLTAVDAFAAQVASTNYVQGAIQSLDSSVTATAGTALTGVTVVDGKITGKTEAAIPSLTGYATEAYVDQAETDAIAAAAEAAKIYIDDAELTAKGYATTEQVATAKSEAISSANSYTDSEIGEIGDMTVKAYVDAAKTAATYDDTALAARVGANETAIGTLNAEQDTQDAEIAKKANSADVYAKTVADTTFVKVSDVVDEYVAPTAL